MGYSNSKQPVNQQVQDQRNDQSPAIAQFVDNRASSITQLQMQRMMSVSPQAVAQHQSQASVHVSPVTQRQVIQNHADEESVQGKFSAAPAAQFAEKPNNTGLPNQLKTGIESLSGMSMDHVKVHFNSGKPAQLNAHAYAQGSDIHVAPGQEKHLPHEAWHVVQQAQGRVKPTMQMKAGVPVNDDAGLEREADVMGEKALQLASGAEKKLDHQRDISLSIPHVASSPFYIQRKISVTTAGALPGATYEENTRDFNVTEVAAGGDVGDYVPAPGVPAHNPHKDYAGSNQTGYLLNVSSMNKSGAPNPTNQGDIEAKHTVTRYNKGFANATEARNKLRMVINVNQHNDARTTLDIPNLLATAVNAQRSSEEIQQSFGRVAIIGHLWNHSWTRSDTGTPVSVDAVKAEYQAQLAAGTSEATLKADYSKAQFGFGQMREVTFKHPQTANFKTHFDNRHLNTFVHLGDGDIVDVTIGGNNTGIYDRMDTWRAASAGNRTKKLIGGGVEYRAQNAGGDAPNEQGDFVKVLSDIDMKNRDSMASVDGRAPWMTEPNTFVDYATLNGIAGPWKGLPNFMVDMGSALSSQVAAGEATFNARDLSIVSSANTHNVAIADPAHAPTLPEFINGLQNYKDSSFRPGPWISRIIKTLDMVGAGRNENQATKLCVYIMREKVNAIADAEAAPELKQIFTNHQSGKWTAAWGRPQRVTLWGGANVTKVESFADQLVVQIKAAWTAYNSM